MKFKSSYLPYILTVLIVIGAFLYYLPPRAHAQSGTTNTSFTYQGRLVKSNQYVNNSTCDFQFGLYASADAGDITPLGTGVQSLTAVPVRDGYFTVNLDFGPVFTGSQRYLQIAVQCPPDETFTSLAPRVLLRAAPYAQYAHGAPWVGLTGIPAGFADGVDNDTVYVPGDGILVNGNTLSASLAAGGGLSMNTNRQIRVDFGGSGATSTAARSDHNHDATYINSGETAGGALTGTYPSPSLAANAVGTTQIVDGAVNSGKIADGAVNSADIADGAVNSAKIADGSVNMADTVNWMSFNIGSKSFGTDGAGVDLFGTAFTPSASGVCLVSVSAVIESTGSASSDPYPELEILASHGGTISEDPYVDMPFSNGDVSADHPMVASSNYVFTVYAGQSTQFGCRVTDPDGTGNDWGSDETVSCRVAYICQ